ncbi:MAG: addiction module protein [Deltaproteobacteria bacterium]|nr:addiction module protein [Deltaproteobacteria bacterium]
MSRSAEALIKEAMALPDAERASLIDGLLATLDPEKDAGADQAWAMEIERRGAELEQGIVESVAWEEVRKKALRLAHADPK